MSHNLTPDDVVRLIRETRAELLRGSDYLHDAELAAERAEDAAELAYNAVLMQVEGSIPIREAQAHAATVAERDVGFVARARVNRVKAKIKALESSLVSLQSELRWMKDSGA